MASRGRMTSLGLGASCAVTGAAFALIVLAAAMIEHPLPRSDEAVAMMAERGVAADPTLVPYVYIFDLAGGYYGSTSLRFSFSKDDNVAMLRRLRDAGVKTGIGTDLVLDWFRYLPLAYITELKGFVEAGSEPGEGGAGVTNQADHIRIRAGRGPSPKGPARC